MFGNSKSYDVTSFDLKLQKLWCNDNDKPKRKPKPKPKPKPKHKPKNKPKTKPMTIFNTFNKLNKLNNKFKFK